MSFTHQPLGCSLHYTQTHTHSYHQPPAYGHNIIPQTPSIWSQYYTTNPQHMVTISYHKHPAYGHNIIPQTPSIWSQYHTTNPSIWSQYYTTNTQHMVTISYHKHPAYGHNIIPQTPSIWSQYHTTMILYNITCHRGYLEVLLETAVASLFSFHIYRTLTSSEDYRG